MLHVHSVQWNAGMGNTDTLHPNSCFCSFSIPTSENFLLQSINESTKVHKPQCRCISLSAGAMHALCRQHNIVVKIFFILDVGMEKEQKQELRWRVSVLPIPAFQCVLATQI